MTRRSFFSCIAAIFTVPLWFRHREEAKPKSAPTTTFGGVIPVIPWCCATTGIEPSRATVEWWMYDGDGRLVGHEGPKPA